MPDPVLHAVLRIALALLFGMAAVHKLRDPGGFREALRGYALLPESAIAPAVRAFPAAELLAAVLLVFAPVFGASTALALLALYTGAIALNLARGRRAIDCGCGGPARRPLGGELLARNALLVLATLACVLPPATRSFVWLDGFTIVAGSVALALLYAAADTALANALPAPEGGE